MAAIHKKTANNKGIQHKITCKKKTRRKKKNVQNQKKKQGQTTKIK